MARERESIRQFPETPAAGPEARPGGQRELALAFAAGLLPVLLLWLLLRYLGFDVGGPAALLLAALGLALSLAWVYRRGLTRSPAMAEARLMALTSRIRPHFLFNSLNAVLGTIRSDPRAAETALEEMAELFRALMQDPRHLVPLSDELALCRKYLALERLRLGERVQVQWDVDACPPDALVPPLMLQPLLENAVYHGIEPIDGGGVLIIRIVSAGGMVAMELSNPYEPRHDHAQGNRMAMDNIRERLGLFFGLGASLEHEVRDGRYFVRLVFPYARGGA
ncbi:MAG TPA: histidine kinase [Rhodocyclaceae bacterium]